MENTELNLNHPNDNNDPDMTNKKHGLEDGDSHDHVPPLPLDSVAPVSVPLLNSLKSAADISVDLRNGIVDASTTISFHGISYKVPFGVKCRRKQEDHHEILSNIR